MRVLKTVQNYRTGLFFVPANANNKINLGIHDDSPEGISIEGIWKGLGLPVRNIGC